MSWYHDMNTTLEDNTIFAPETFEWSVIYITCYLPSGIQLGVLSKV
jgi:hypothetical protein